MSAETPEVGDRFTLGRTSIPVRSIEPLAGEKVVTAVGEDKFLYRLGRGSEVPAHISDWQRVYVYVPPTPPLFVADTWGYISESGYYVTALNEGQARDAVASPAVSWRAGEPVDRAPRTLARLISGQIHILDKQEWDPEGAWVPLTRSMR